MVLVSEWASSIYQSAFGVLKINPHREDELLNEIDLFKFYNNFLEPQIDS